MGDGPRKVLYEELRPEEFLDRVNECPIAYLPLGTLEWHGFHLPLGSDGLQAKGFFAELAGEVGGVVLPMLFLGPDGATPKDGSEYYGMDALSFEEGHMQQLPGSAYHMDGEAFAAMLATILANLSRAGFKVVVGHGHGPSTGAFAKNAARWGAEYGLRLFTLWEIGVQGRDGIQCDHAAYNETSIILGLRPELADLATLTDDARMVGIGGYDPRVRATEANGRRIIDMNKDKVGARLREELAGMSWERRSFGCSHVKRLYKDEDAAE
ncbi:MAG: creatininase family protein [Oscillospiraceae bacterium]|nr:creatininase family protein [Oscillospiraceae bacterium]